MPEREAIYATHELTLRITRVLRPIFEQAEGRMKAALRGQVNLPKLELALSPVQQYQFIMFRALAPLTSSLERMRHVQTYLGRFPTPRLYEKQGIGSYDWVQYHQGYHDILCVGFGDQALILTNAAFQLGLPPSLCTGRILLSNARLSDHPIKRVLKAILSHSQRHASRRNEHVHQGHQTDVAAKFDSQYLKILQVYGNPLLRGALGDDGGPTHESLRVIYKAAMASVQNELREDETRFGSFAVELMDALLPVYERQIAEIRTLTTGLLEPVVHCPECGHLKDT